MTMTYRFLIAALAALTVFFCGCDKEKAPNKEKENSEKLTKIDGDPVFDPQMVPTVIHTSSGHDVDALLKQVENETNTVVLAQLATFLSQTTKRGPSVRAAFKKLLASEDKDLREQTLMALEDYAGVSFMLDDLIPFLNDPDEDIRDDAMTTVADYVKGKKKYQTLIDCLDSQYQDVVDNAVFNLGFYTDKDYEKAEDWKKWWEENKDTFQPTD